MPKFKVVNPDAPEEIDFYQDIPLVDPDTGADQLDSEGNILVKRYVNHTVSIKGINEVKKALPAIKTNTQNIKELSQYSHTQNEAHQKAINENSNAIVELNTSTSGMALDLETLKNKINGIQGIDIDDLKDYVNTQVPLIKNSYLPLVGGTITGNLTIKEGTITGSLTGVASNATADVNNKELTSYIADIMGANAQLSIIKGDGTTSVLSINNVLNATKATNADNATNLGGYPATDYIRSVNGINADEQGNVQLGNLVRSVNGLIADAHGNVNVKVLELQRDVQKSLTGTLSATLTNTDSTAKTVTKSYTAYSSNEYSNASSYGFTLQDTDTFTYGVTFSSNPTVSTSNSSYFRVSSVTTTNAKIARYVYRTTSSNGTSSGHGPAYIAKDTRPAGTATATGQIIGSKVVSKTVSKTVNYGVTYKNAPTISNVVGCTVSNIGTTACTVSTTLSTTLSSGQSTTLSSDFSFDVVGDIIISSED